MSIDLIRFSKTISYALRHHPEEFDLTLDEEGWIPIEVLLHALRKRKVFEDARVEDIQMAIQKSQKKRFEITENKIRACYGHSIPKNIHYVEQEPPEFLYHGTARKNISSIQQQGLTPQNRQYVHLSSSQETAVLVGSRHDTHPVILLIEAHKAWEDGIAFYDANDATWLCKKLPSQYIQFEDAV